MSTLRLLPALSLILGGAVVMTCSVEAQEVTVVFPTAYESVEGPGGTSTGQVSPLRIQAVLSAEEAFSELPETHRRLVGFRHRPDSETEGPLTSHVDNIVIRFSTTDKAPGELSDTFSENIGEDETIVYEGPLTIRTENTGLAEGPRDFDIVYDFQRPFDYDPSQGNLLLDWSWFSPTTVVGVDECCEDDSQLSQWIIAAGPLAEVATGGGRATTIAQFVFVPEPSSALLGFMAIASLIAVRRRR